MNIKQVMILCLSVWGTASPYVTKETWKRAQAEGQLPEAVRTQFDEFFTAHPDFSNLFTQEKYVGPAAWHGVLDAQTAEKNGWVKTEDGYYKYCTAPNTHFPSTFNADTQLWMERPTVTFFEETEEEARERIKQRAEIYDTIDAVLNPLALKNQTERGGNIVVSLEPQGLDYVVWGTWRAWTTYPQLASRYFTARGVQQYLADNDFKKITVPNQYLYHVPGTSDDLTDSNWLVVSEAIKNQFSPTEMRKALVRMNMIYALLDPQSGVTATPEQVEKMLAEYPALSHEDSCQGVCYRTLQDIQNNTISADEIDDACACIREMHHFLRPENSYLWKPLVQWSNDVVDAAGEPVLREANIALAQNADGTHTIYLIDFEMPSIAGPTTDEQRCMEFTGELDGLLSFAKYLQKDLLESWEFLTTP